MTLNRILVKNMSKQVVIKVLIVCLINLSLPLVEANGNSSMDLLTDFTPWSNLLEEATLGLVFNYVLPVHRATNKGQTDEF